MEFLPWAGTVVLLMLGEGLASIAYALLALLGGTGSTDEEKGFTTAAFILMMIVTKVVRMGRREK